MMKPTILIVDNGHIDLVVLGIMMPTLDGLEQLSKSAQSSKCRLSF
ncbi:hypothetical protein J14TS2_04850 [Bacillus sp. J14TS2]|nr:hypothetical protein [Bacillus sp. J14TS2]GIN70010.1 hypothetical protein J14TS2_04850 [Bacillus sp. J14TS2]